MLLLRHALASLFNYGTHMSRSHFISSHCVCGGLGYRGFGVKIETDSALEVRAKTPNSFELSTEITSRCPTGPLSAAVMSPFASKDSSSGVGDFGAQVNCAIAPVEMKNA